jgi:hypothetical protein
MTDDELDVLKRLELEMLRWHMAAAKGYAMALTADEPDFVKSEWKEAYYAMRKFPPLKWW